MTDQLNNKIADVRDLASVTAKRNTALTVIEPKDVDKTLASIKKRVSAIKHDNKRSQLLFVVRHLERMIAESGVKTGIFCVAQKMNGDIYYKHIAFTDGILPKESAYYYDDVFHILKIQEIVFDLKPASDKEMELLTKTVMVSTDTSTGQSGQSSQHYTREFFVDNEITANLPHVRTIYHITKSDTPRIVPFEWLEAGCSVRMIVDRKFDDKSPLLVYKDVGL
ncbi:hypothetical protein YASMINEVIRUS_1545 [Yasminevirus sp. GU-2018]|uniref:Uncharacterized protein n=1 Tax=Yasminevirus sp. GU-2018 TaxID=2420051 RepID=A0A5K0UBK0_9VIRU|nr:hypothetical protein YASMINEVIRUS_1545 [Yasminevirus sp. GU-2018]